MISSSKPTKPTLAFSIGVPALIWQVLFFYLPLLLIIVSSFVNFSSDGLFEGVTLSKILFFAKIPYLKVIAASFLLALANGLICLSIAYPLAYILVFTYKKVKNILLFLLIVPFWTNFLLHVYAWFFVLEKEGFLNNLLRMLHITSEPIHFLNSPFAIMVMMVYYYLPFMVMPLYSAMEKMDIRLVEASCDLGAKFFQTFYQVIVPLTKRGLIAGFFLVYIPSFGEFAIPELMGGNREMFVGSVVSHYILGDQTGSLGAAFTVTSAFFLSISSAILFTLMNRWIPGVRLAKK